MSGDDHSMIVERALNSLGKGFDLTSDFQLKYCKGGKQRLVVLNDTDKRELTVPGFRTIQNVSVDIKCDKGDRTRYQSDILTFNQMSEFFNQGSSVPGKIPSGLFNAMFGFDSGSWAKDAANIKHLALDGYFIIFFNVHIDRYPLVLAEDVCESVPSTWDPPALARFIEKYGTHIVVGLSVGAEDVLLVKQDKSSNMQPSDLKNHLHELGDQHFTGACSFSPSHSKSKDQKHKVPQTFNVFHDPQLAINGFSTTNTKDGTSVTFYKKGGDPMASSHYEWLLTAPSMLDAIQFSFIPITSLLKDVPGKGLLSHAINLYLRYKPPIDDLQYFLDFQTHKLWAPVLNELALGPASNRTTQSPAIHVSLMGPKLYVNSAQVRVAFRPVTGMRLYLEGRKGNRLAVHLQHLSNTPFMLQNKIDDTPTWRGSDEIADDRYFEAINRKKISHVCTVPVKYDPKWMSSKKDASFIVSGVQLVVKKHDTKNVLHLRLLFSKVSDHFVVQSNWTEPPSEHSQKSSSSGLFSAISTSISGSNWSRDRVLPDDDRVIVDSSVFPTGPPVPLQLQKFVKYVDMSHLCRGPQDGPGYWLVTGARLNLVKGKISLQVKFSLLNLCSPSPPVSLRDLMYNVVDLEA
ncbi:MACPF domain-containing protein [Pyrus ussuriensis x Pyrus communis]|uniref:MACPF domain-containing protein n=1 Tax=Pyrus ussuriensis x Pyrus communis TaxID=2448454 RepID=A0A5N5HAA4_9ROSA|nr:MACPF domain-containing protein [Pyrus ussuriensis x Pyrus communis]